MLTSKQVLLERCIEERIRLEKELKDRLTGFNKADDDKCTEIRQQLIKLRLKMDRYVTYDNLMQAPTLERR